MILTQPQLALTRADPLFVAPAFNTPVTCPRQVVGAVIHARAVARPPSPRDIVALTRARSMWRVLFAMLRRSPYVVRLAALQDASVLLLQNSANCASLRAQRGWQLGIFSLLTDVPSARCRSPFLQSVFGYTLNLFAATHFDALLRFEGADRVLCESLDALQSFAGLSGKTQELARLLIVSLLKKAGAQAASFPSHTYDDVAWHNVLRWEQRLARVNLLAATLTRARSLPQRPRSGSPLRAADALLANWCRRAARPGLAAPQRPRYRRLAAPPLAIRRERDAGGPARASSPRAR
jgi:hypothetical protein